MQRKATVIPPALQKTQTDMGGIGIDLVRRWQDVLLDCITHSLEEINWLGEDGHLLSLRQDSGSAQEVPGFALGPSSDGGLC